MDVAELGSTIENTVYYALGAGIFLGVLISFLYARYLVSFAKVSSYGVADSNKRFNGNGYEGRYRNNGEIEYIQATHGAVRILARFEEEGIVRIYYQEYEKPVSEVKPLNIAKVKSKSAFFEFDKDRLVGTGNLDNNSLSGESLFQNFPVTIVPRSKSE